MGLYRDDGLAVIQGSGPQLERMRKNVFKLFHDINLKVTIETNTKSTNFLDVTFNLMENMYKPYRKDNDKPIYINRLSNHPPIIKKKLPEMINKRLVNLSSSEKVFYEEAPLYDEALKNAGYKHKLTYNTEVITEKIKNRVRRRNVIWFNPPYNESVRTDIGRKFLNLLDKHFENQPNLKKHFNRHTVKLSYSCSPNIQNHINSHNKTLLNNGQILQKEGCNCRKGSDNCPLDGSCKTKSLIYKAKVNTEDETIEPNEYIGLSSLSFKSRYSNHESTFNLRYLASRTSLSKYIWSLKDRKINYNIQWSILRQAPTYNQEQQKCELCLLEKTFILQADKNTSLNKRHEIISKCRHRDRLLLKNM